MKFIMQKTRACQEGPKLLSLMVDYVKVLIIGEFGYLGVWISKMKMSDYDYKKTQLDYF